MLSLIGTALSGLLGLGTSWLENRQAISRAKTEAKIEVMKRQAQQDIDWEQSMAAGAQHSWKDEWFTILISVPFILVFYEPTRETAQDGFRALEELVPDEYWVLLFIAYAASFGVRPLVKYALSRFGIK